jgi:serine/threonine protein kinase
MEQIGEGGIGLVFVAEQQQPVRRRVALQIIKPGMNSRDVIDRFEAERQALALVDHPNIARVFDAGTTDSGRPSPSGRPGPIRSTPGPSPSSCGGSGACRTSTSTASGT